MKLNIRILRTDNSIEHREVVSDCVKITDAAVQIGISLRKTDSTLCAIRIDGVERYQWVGNYTAEHMAVIAARENNGTSNW